MSDKLREALEAVLSAGRGPSGRIILERYQEDKLREALAADDAARGTMREAFEAFCPYKGSPDPWVVWQACWQAATRAAALPCGHPTSLMLHSAETGEPLYCELCDDKSGRADAECMESELLAANESLRGELAAQQAAPTEADRLDAQRLDYIAQFARCDPKMDGQHVWWPTSFNHRLTGPTLRDAIDAARSAQAGGKEQGS